MKIFVTATFPGAAEARLEAVLAGRGIRATGGSASNLVASEDDAAMTDAEVVFGQPSLRGIERAAAVRWIHLTSAGYTRFATPEARALLRDRGIALTTSSTVYAEPCATHALALLLALERQLPRCFAEQAGPRGWPASEVRASSHVLSGRRALLLGYGAIGQRLTDLLLAFRVEVSIVRRHTRGDERGRVVTLDQARTELASFDYLIDTLPESDSTRGLVDRAMIEGLRPGATLINIGRGTTIDQAALLGALQSGALRAALDVTDPEPLPPEHPLWTAPNCIITPHSAGGRDTEHLELVEHFARNLLRYERSEPLADLID